MSLIGKLNAAPRHPDVTEALEAYTTALKACDKAEEALKKAAEVAKQREAELEAVLDRLAATAG